MSLHTAPWIILFAPLIAAALILFFGRSSKQLSAGLALFSVGLSCVLSWWVFLQHPADLIVPGFQWIQVGTLLDVSIGFTLDRLSSVMLVVVTTIAPLVFIYSLGYMAHEEGYSRYFAGLSLFLFSMLGIVLADNLLMMFIFWELVGVSSYILIGHYFSKNSAANAAKQAFTVNRIGDFGFMVGILMIWHQVGSLNFTDIQLNIGLLTANPVYFTVALICIFCGTIGKSAQVPLHVWLPNSMEGPTPVSSLLHAATMVAAGVYMLARLFFAIEIENVAQAREVIAWIGGITLFLAALMATQQNDIKRILAYSTISQLGYMVMAIGLAKIWDVAMFHLFTHAFFKCLLFLCAGSVIVGMHHEQNIWKMGALKNKMPVTFLCTLLGALALSGCPFFSGYYSKDVIIAVAFETNTVLFWLSAVAAALTAFYTFRLVTVVFLGPPRSDEAKHASESPKVMLVPLTLLALAAFGAGWPIVEKLFFQSAHVHPLPWVHWMLIAFFLIGVGGAYALYHKAKTDPLHIPLFANRFYIDNGYAWLVRYCQDGLATVFSWIDRWVIDGAVVLGGRLTGAAGFVLRYFQVGSIQTYAFFFGAGVVALLCYLIAK